MRPSYIHTGSSPQSCASANDFLHSDFFFFKRGEGGEREVDLLLHPFMYSLVDSVRDQTLTLGTTGQYSNQLSYPARAPGDF